MCESVVLYKGILRIILIFDGENMVYTTGKKKLITELLSRNSNTSYTIEEIVEAVTGDGKGKSTVYRLVSELVANGFVRRLSDGKTRHCTYQYVGDEHCHRHMHLKCNGCGKLIHLDENTTRAFEKKILTLDGFSIEEGSFIYGTCRECTEVIG